MSPHDEVDEAFPELYDIRDGTLRERVIDAWVVAPEENGSPELASFPWYGPYQERLGLADETLVGHTRDVTAVAVAIADALEDRRGTDIDRDAVLAGALVHDVSHLGEFDGWERAATGDLLGHPYYGLHVVRSAGLPVEIEHIVLSHTSQTDVRPATIEAEIVARADAPVASDIVLRSVEDLREKPPIAQH